MHPLLISNGAKPRRGLVKQCRFCGQDFYIRQSIAYRIYCSSDCSSKSRLNNTPLMCAYCGSPFYVSKSQQKYRHRICCSKRCQGKYFAKRGSESPFWRGGVTDVNRQARNSEAMRDWRWAVFVRDRFTCQSCGIRNGRDVGSIKLHAHHVKQFATHPELRFDVANGLTLCEDCHYQAGHKRPRKVA